MQISILMPFKNAASWLEETVQSVLEQTEADWELIAVDDHSDDGSAELLRAVPDSRIHVLKNEGSGIISALQMGLNKAQGTFITRMDADDLMPPNKLALLLELVSSNKNRCVATGKVRYFSTQEVTEGYRNYESWMNERVDENDHYKHIFRECVIASPNWMVRREFIVADRIFEKLQYPEDYDMTFHWMQNNYEIHPTKEVTHLWREHPQRTSRNSEVYDQASFFNLKLNWFAKLHSNFNRLAVFGVGPKGKLIVEQLQDRYEISWYDVQFENYMAPILNHKIQNPEDAREPMALIAVYPTNRELLEHFLLKKGYVVGKNAWYV